MKIAEGRRRYIEWLNATRGLSPHTIRAYDEDLRAFQRRAGPTCLVSEITRVMLVEFLDAERGRGVSASTLKRRSSGVRGFCRWLVESGELASDPWAGVTVSVGRRRRLPRHVPAAALESLLATLLARATSVAHDANECDPHETTTLVGVAMMVATGVRVSELVSMRCQDVDLDRGTIRILGKGSRERHVFVTNEWLSRTIRHYLQLRSSLGVAHDQVLFNRRLGPMTPPAMRGRLARVVNEARLGLTVTPHMLRHTAATQLIEAGVDIRLIQTLLGHASLNTTEIYTHVSNLALQRVLVEVDVLGRAMTDDN